MKKLYALTQINYQPYAMVDELSQGRAIKEDKDTLRTCFQHDRDRIIHSKAFRRLESKTQVVLSNESDHNRKRLTHSLEVMQISDTIANALGVNIFLTQAIALGHDLGHTPFGHGGEDALKDILADHNLPRFKHNYQSLLVVNRLEERYREEGGLNLLFETRDGILKHTKTRDDIPIDYYDSHLDNSSNPITIEGQIVRIVDEIAQRTHDTDDALHTGRIKLEQLLKQDIMIKVLSFNNMNKSSLSSSFEKNKNIAISKIVRAMINFYAWNVIVNSKKNLKLYKIKTYEDVIKAEPPIVAFPKEIDTIDEKFQKAFLRPRFYDHFQIKRMDSRGKYFIKQLFKAFKKNPGQLHERDFDKFNASVLSSLEKAEINDASKIAGTCKKGGCSYIENYKLCFVSEKSMNENLQCPLQKQGRPACEGIRAIVNYIASMTDRYANMEYARLYLPPEI